MNPLQHYVLPLFVLIAPSSDNVSEPAVRQQTPHFMWACTEPEAEARV